MSPPIDVIIPTLQPLRWLPACLRALEAQTRQDFEVWVVDNSGGGAQTAIDAVPAGSALASRIHLINNPTNTGFAGACNQGIRASTGSWVGLLNDDTEPAPGWLAALVAAGESAREYYHSGKLGSVASLMVYASQPGTVQSAGIAMDRAAIAWDRLGGRPVGEALAAQEIFGASGGAALYRRAMLDEIGQFDERFFAYLEDVDLAWRAQRAGWRCWYAPDALVAHVTSATSGAGSAFKNRLLGRNKLWMAAKNARRRDWPVIAFYDLLAVLWAGVSRREWSHLRGRVDGIKQIAAFFQDPSAKASSVGTRIQLDPCVAPWKVPKRMSN